MFFINHQMDFLLVECFVCLHVYKVLWFYSNLPSFFSPRVRDWSGILFFARVGEWQKKIQAKSPTLLFWEQGHAQITILLFAFKM
jgi:hypothetical protein